MPPRRPLKRSRRRDDAPERTPGRDAAIEATLPRVPFDGWTRRALRIGLADIGEAAEDADLLFPGGAPDMIEAFCDWADRRMEASAASLDLALLRTHEKVRAVIVAAARAEPPVPRGGPPRSGSARLAGQRAAGGALYRAHRRCDLARGR